MPANYVNLVGQNYHLSFYKIFCDVLYPLEISLYK